jgi:hypothetical protein
MAVDRWRAQLSTILDDPLHAQKKKQFPKKYWGGAKNWDGDENLLILNGLIYDRSTKTIPTLLSSTPYHVYCT